MTWPMETTGNVGMSKMGDEGVGCRQSFSSITEVGWADDETGNALLDRAAFYSQAPPRLRCRGSDDAYPGAALLRKERSKRLSGSSR